MRPKLTIRLISVLIITISCDKDEMSSEPILIGQIGDQISLINQTEETLYYFIVDQNALPVIFWTPSINEDQPRLAPRGQARIDLREIVGFSERTTTLALYYWEATEGMTDKIPGPVGELIYNL